MIKVMLVGLGAMGSGMAKMILDKKGIKIVSVIDKNPNKINKDLGEVLELDKTLNIKVKGDLDIALKQNQVDIVILSIDSFIKNIFTTLKKIINSKKNCITIAEEMAYGEASEKKLSKALHYLCKKNNVTILGTGVNPGFVLDTLVAVLTAPCIKVDRVVARRVNDLSPFGPTVMKTQGVGTTVEEFEKGILNKNIVGHIGFRQSISLVAKALGIKIDEIIESKEPIVSNVYRETEYVKVEPGMVAGCNHIAYGINNGEKVIVMEHPQQIKPDFENVKTGDYIEIYGTPNIKMSITPEIPGGIGTMAMAVNMIPHVIAAKAGLKTMLDLPLPHGIENSFEDQLKNLRGFKR